MNLKVVSLGSPRKSSLVRDGYGAQLAAWFADVQINETCRRCAGWYAIGFLGGWRQRDDQDRSEDVWRGLVDKCESVSGHTSGGLSENLANAACRPALAGHGHASRRAALWVGPVPAPRAGVARNVHELAVPPGVQMQFGAVASRERPVAMQGQRHCGGVVMLPQR